MQKQIFCQLLYILMMTLRSVSMANIIIKNEKPGSLLRGTENKFLSLECTFEGIYTGEVLVWTRNGRLMTDGRNGHAVYSFIPMKHDNLAEFCCELHDTWKGKIKEKVVTLDIKYKPVLEFNFTEENLFIQGETKRLCCTSDGNPSTKSMWIKNKKISVEVHYKSNVCLTLMNISESDSGKYSCFAENEIGFVEQEININVLYPPVFAEEHNMIQFGKLGENITFKLVVHTVSIIKCCHIEGENRAKRRPNIMFPKNTTHLYHGTDIVTKELVITFSFTEMQTSDYQKYKITVCNHDGNSSCFVELQPMNTEFELPHALGLDGILMSLLTIILLVAGMVFALVKRLKIKRKPTPVNEIEVVEDSTEAVENVLYQSTTFRCTEVTQRCTLTESVAVSNFQRSNHTNEETERLKRLSNRLPESTRQLNYADITFNSIVPGSETRIIGLENKTTYADVDLTNDQIGVLETLNELNSDDEDFVEIEDLEIFSHRKNEIAIENANISTEI